MVQSWSGEAAQLSLYSPEGAAAAVRYQDEVLRATVRPDAGAVDPGFF